MTGKEWYNELSRRSFEETGQSLYPWELLGPELRESYDQIATMRPQLIEDIHFDDGDEDTRL